MTNRATAVLHAMLTVALGSAALLGQQKPVAPSASLAIEFPVTMRQDVVAGATAVGTKVQAKLAVGTLVNRVVVPQDAVLSGEVIESVAKSAKGPSRLAIRMDSARWKNGSAPIKVYLTAWYFPLLLATDEDPPSMGPVIRPRRRSPPDPSPIGPASPLPSSKSGQDTGPAPSGLSKHRVLMKNVVSTRNSDGAVTLTSTRFNIKLDKQTTYVLAAVDLLPTR